MMPVVFLYCNILTETKNNSTSITDNQRIGRAMKQIRLSNNLNPFYVATHIGYTDDSTYYRLERGETEHIDESKIRTFCKLMDCNIVHLYKLAGIEVFETKIKTWDEFYSLIPKLNDEEAKHIIELAKKIIPPKKSIALGRLHKNTVT